MEKARSPRGKGQAEPERPWPPSPRRSAEGRTREPDGGWSWQGGPSPPPALPPPRLVPPLWSQRPHTRGALLSPRVSTRAARAGAQPGRSVPRRLSYAEVRCCPGLGSPLRAQEPVGGIQVWRRGVLLSPIGYAVGLCAEWINTGSCVEPRPRNLSNQPQTWVWAWEECILCPARHCAVSPCSRHFPLVLLYCSSTTPILTPSWPWHCPSALFCWPPCALSAHSAHRPSGRLAAGLPSLSPTLAPSLHPLSSRASSSGSPAVKPVTSPLTLPASLLLALSLGPFLPSSSLDTGHASPVSGILQACPLGVTCSYMVSTNSSLARDHFDHMVTPVWFLTVGTMFPTANKPSLGRKEMLRNRPHLKIPQGHRATRDKM